MNLSGRAPAGPPTILAGLARRAVVVTLTDESGARGVAWQADSSGLMLTAAAGQPVEVITPDGHRDPADGALFIPADRIKFVQLIEGVP